MLTVKNDLTKIIIAEFVVLTKDKNQIYMWTKTTIFIELTVLQAVEFYYFLKQTFLFVKLIN